MADNEIRKLELDPITFDIELSRMMEEQFEFAQTIASEYPLISIVHAMSVLECYFVGIALSHKDEVYRLKNAQNNNTDPKESKKKIHEWGLSCLTDIMNRLGVISDETRNRCVRFIELRNHIHIYQKYLDNKKNNKSVDRVDAEQVCNMVISVISNVNTEFSFKGGVKVTLSPYKKSLLSKLVLIGAFSTANDKDITAVFNDT